MSNTLVGDCPVTVQIVLNVLESQSLKFEGPNYFLKKYCCIIIEIFNEFLELMIPFSFFVGGF